MDGMLLPQGQRELSWDLRALAPQEPTAGSRTQIVSLGVLYAHALAIDYEAEARYRDFAAHMTDYGNDATAALFLRLAEVAAKHASDLAKKCAGLEIPLLVRDEYAWLDCGAPVPEARAFVYCMMTPRLALHIALLAEERGKAYFDHVRIESRHADVRNLAAEFARDKLKQVAWLEDALACLPEPFRPTEHEPGDPAIEQQL